MYVTIDLLGIYSELVSSCLKAQEGTCDSHFRTNSLNAVKSIQFIIDLLLGYHCEPNLKISKFELTNR